MFCVLFMVCLLTSSSKPTSSDKAVSQATISSSGSLQAQPRDLPKSAERRAGARLSRHQHKGAARAVSEDKTSEDLPSTPSSASQEGITCAVCFIGQLKALDETAHGLRTKLLKSLGHGGVRVDVFVAAEQGGPSTIKSFGLQGGNPASILKYTWRAQQSAKEMEDALSSKAPKNATDFYRRSPGNWLGPMFGSPGNGARIYRLQRDCIDMIKEREASEKIRYTWVMRTRPDFVWTAPHPPLSLTSLDRVWHFGEENYGGVNVRHLYGSRDMMFSLLDGQHLLEVGDPVIYKMEANELRNDEAFDELVAERFGAKFGSVAYAAFLHANPDWASNGWRKAGQDYPKEVGYARTTAVELAHGGCWRSISDSKVGVAACSHVSPPKNRRFFDTQIRSLLRRVHSSSPPSKKQRRSSR